MKRRQFLQSTLVICSALYLEPSLGNICRAIEGEAASALLLQRSALKDIPVDEQQYFRWELLVTGVPEIIASTVPAEFLFIIKNCQPGELAGQTQYDNPYIRRIDIAAYNQQDCLVRLVMREKTKRPEMRYTLSQSVLRPGKSWFKIEVGRFSRETAIKEQDLGVQESQLVFGPMGTRESTDTIVIHHVGVGAALETASEIHRLHLQNGWSGIGYHYVIHKDGVIERGRPRETVGAHAYHYNKTSLGIVLVGNFEEETPTAIQMERAAMLIAALSHIYQLSPDASHVLGHRDLNDTLCPGESLYVQLPTIRAQAQAFMRR